MAGLWNSRDELSLNTALVYAVHRWLRGMMEQAPPTLEEGMLILDHLSDHVLTANLDAQQVLEFRQLLVTQTPDLSHHFADVVMHRRWVQAVFELWELVSPEEEPAKTALSHLLRRRVQEHDLSKFSAHEALGYHYLFHAKSAPRALSFPTKEALWEKALDHHYRGNDHHPQYWFKYRCPTHDSRSQGTMPWPALVESVLDMVASRLQRSLSDQHMICPEQLMAVPQQFLTRYDQQKIEVNKYLFDWGTKLSDLLRWIHGPGATVLGAPLQAWQDRYGILFEDRDAVSNPDGSANPWEEDWQTVVDIAYATSVVTEFETECENNSLTAEELAGVEENMLLYPSANEVDLIEPEDLLCSDCSEEFNEPADLFETFIPGGISIM
jgi:hypothetical protein